MNLREAIARASTHQDLAFEEMREVMQLVMAGEATPAQIGGLLVALRMKGETVDEITAAASVMRSLAVKVEVGLSPLVDTCGTGGDSAGTFNISTAAAFVVAAAGGHVAKHGNRSVSSSSGSADLLEAAGVNLALAPGEIARCIREVGFGFMFAQAHHGATRHAAGPRRELGIRTLFNVLGPLTNPAGADRMVLGIFSPDWVPRIAEVLRRLGARRALVVHARDGLDEISLGDTTLVAELDGDHIREYEIDPLALGIARTPSSALKVANASESLARITEIFAGAPGPARDIVAINAGAALTVCDLAPDLSGGYSRALALIDSGAARESFERYIAFTRQFASPPSA